MRLGSILIFFDSGRTMSRAKGLMSEVGEDPQRRRPPTAQNPSLPSSRIPMSSTTVSSKAPPAPPADDEFWQALVGLSTLWGSSEGA